MPAAAHNIGTNHRDRYLPHNGMSAETKIKGNKFAFAFVICVAAVGYVAGFF